MCFGLFTKKDKLLLYSESEQEALELNKEDKYKVRKLTKKELSDSIQKVKISQYRELQKENEGA